MSVTPSSVIPDIPIVTCYFSPQSGYAYLGHEQLRALALKAGAEIRWRPVDILKVFSAGGSTAPAKQSAPRNAYRKKDIARWARKLGIPMNTEPAFWPTDTLPACRMLAAAELSGLDVGDLAGAMLKAVWARDLQIADRATLVRLADELDLNGEALASKSDDPDCAILIEANTQDAIARGVFGSPTYGVGDDLYFGQDRLPFVADRLKEHKAAHAGGDK